MANEQDSSSQKADASKAEESADVSETKMPVNIQLVGDTPIVITGGSVYLEYSDKPDDGFDADFASGGKKGVKHKKNSGDKVELSYVDITDGSDKLMMRINLVQLGKHKDCKIKIYYELKP
jgi:hypothetical protein